MNGINLTGTIQWDILHKIPSPAIHHSRAGGNPESDSGNECRVVIHLEKRPHRLRQTLGSRLRGNDDP